jgi:hypothetical protein
MKNKDIVALLKIVLPSWQQLEKLGKIAKTKNSL